MRDIHKLEDVVKDVLESDASTRNSDRQLYFKVCQRLDSGVLEHKLGDVLLSFNNYDMPRFESVSRARRKLQAKFPRLKATDEIKERRLEREIMFEEYAKEVF
jgi:hypothetical protein